MHNSLQNKLHSYEVPPPPAAWNNIAAALNDEFVSSDSALASRLDSLEVAPPSHIWNNISGELSAPAITEPATTTPARIIVFRKIAAAAILTGLILMATFYFFSGKDTTSKQIVEVSKHKIRPEKPTPFVPAEPAITEKHTEVSKIKPPAPTRKNRPSGGVHIPVSTTRYEPESSASPEQAPLYELSTVAALQPVSVTAPPIRDKKGNLILDLSTIKSGDDPYITVTGPNGKQTKISSKFLSCLGYMNTSISDDNLDATAARCSMQFAEWRNTLLNGSGFIPTANNFFDIFELKDLLQEM